MILNIKEFRTPFEEISPHELNKCLQKFYLSATKSDDRSRSVIARQNWKGRYARVILLPEHAPGVRSESKAPPCVPTISWVYFILASRISTPQNAPRYLTC